MLSKKLPMTLKCNDPKIIVLEAAAMLHETDAIIAIIDSAYKVTVKKGASTAVPVFGTKYRWYR